jgi:hypothetical protein
MLGAVLLIVAPIGQKQFEVALRNGSSALLLSCRIRRESMVWSSKVIMLLHPLQTPETYSKIFVLEEYRDGDSGTLGLKDAEGADDTVGAGEMDGSADTSGDGETA